MTKETLNDNLKIKWCDGLNIINQRMTYKYSKSVCADTMPIIYAKVVYIK